MNIAHHIRTATGDTTPQEPPALPGDWIVFAFCTGLAAGWLLGSLVGA